ncbi:glycosyltransferase family 4 protein [Woeseia oceani]|uniref:Glycosyl transferase family 1 domain-containing protein n=1 Tax=Woeseia oceani TaxID=1548547 RepID=A0A193LEU5_9GAMM|nr:glycosyltransferase family 4 protein [Woeseia oceani]ANO50976.1 hypothetical protein BA177_06920 [Woeseia oceani]
MVTKSRVLNTSIQPPLPGPTDQNPEHGYEDFPEDINNVDPNNAGNSVLLVGNYAPDEGFSWWLMENFWLQFGELAEQRGVRTLLAYPVQGKLPPHIKSSSQLTPVLLRVPGRTFSELWRACRFIRQQRVHLLYFSDRTFSNWRYVALRLAGAKTLINHAHSGGENRNTAGIRGMVKSILRKIPPFNCDLQFCVSPYMSEKAELSARIPANKLVTIQNGVEPIAVPAANPNYIHELLGIDPATRVCVSSGRADRRKRIDFLIEVANYYVHELQGKNVVFVHCGDGPDLQRLTELVASKGLSEWFRLIGRRSDVPDILRSSSFAIHASASEAFSLAILEFMNSGLATLVPDIASVTQAIDDAQSGFYYRPGDVADAADKVRTLAESPELATTLGAQAKLTANSKYRLDSMNKAFRNAVDQALNRL